jgi:hypothetical protein
MSELAARPEQLGLPLLEALRPAAVSELFTPGGLRGVGGLAERLGGWLLEVCDEALRSHGVRGWAELPLRVAVQAEAAASAAWRARALAGGAAALSASGGCNRLADGGELAALVGGGGVARAAPCSTAPPSGAPPPRHAVVPPAARAQAALLRDAYVTPKPLPRPPSHAGVTTAAATPGPVVAAGGGGPLLPYQRRAGTFRCIDGGSTVRWVQLAAAREVPQRAAAPVARVDAGVRPLARAAPARPPPTQLVMVLGLLDSVERAAALVGPLLQCGAEGGAAVEVLVVALPGHAGTEFLAGRRDGGQGEAATWQLPPPPPPGGAVATPDAPRPLLDPRVLNNELLACALHQTLSYLAARGVFPAAAGGAPRSAGATWSVLGMGSRGAAAVQCWAARYGGGAAGLSTVLLLGGGAYVDATMRALLEAGARTLAGYPADRADLAHAFIAQAHGGGVAAGATGSLPGVAGCISLLAGGVYDTDMRGLPARTRGTLVRIHGEEDVAVSWEAGDACASGRDASRLYRVRPSPQDAAGSRELDGEQRAVIHAACSAGDGGTVEVAVAGAGHDVLLQPAHAAAVAAVLRAVLLREPTAQSCASHAPPHVPPDAAASTCDDASPATITTTTATTSLPLDRRGPPSNVPSGRGGPSLGEGGGALLFALQQQDGLAPPHAEAGGGPTAAQLADAARHAAFAAGLRARLTAAAGAGNEARAARARTLLREVRAEGERRQAQAAAALEGSAAAAAYGVHAAATAADHAWRALVSLTGAPHRQPAPAPHPPPSRLCAGEDAERDGVPNAPPPGGWAVAPPARRAAGPTSTCGRTTRRSRGSRRTGI